MPGFAEALAHHDLEAVVLGEAIGMEPQVMASIQQRAAGSLARAGDQAARVDVRRAGSLYERALALLPPEHPDRAELLSRAGEAESIMGRFPEAAALLEGAIDAFLRQGARLEAARATLDLAYARWNRAGTVGGEEVLDRAFALLEGLPPGREHARAATDRAAGQFFAGDSAGALRATEAALQLANQVGAQDLAARLLEIRGMSRCAMGDQGGLGDLHRALAGSRSLGLGPETVRAYLNLGTFVTPMEGPAAALEYFTAGAELAERRGIVELGMWTKAWELGVLFELGAWDRLLEEGREVLAWDRDRGGSQLRVAALNCTAEVLAYRGGADEAAAMAKAFVGEARAVGDPQIVVPALAVAAVARWSAGDTEGAAEALVGFGEIFPERARWVGSLFIQVCARVGVAVGRVDLVERLAAEPDLTTPRGRWVDASARAELAEARGSFEAALSLHRTAAEGWDGYGFPFERAHSSMGAARCLRALGRPDEATSPALAAAETFGSLGAGGLAATARALAVALA
jgi:tetratricopeptide (TPR) repeat protein